jgi:hypothetical protein
LQYIVEMSIDKILRHQYQNIQLFLWSNTRVAYGSFPQISEFIDCEFTLKPTNTMEHFLRRFSLMCTEYRLRLTKSTSQLPLKELIPFSSFWVIPDGTNLQHTILRKS